MDLKARFLYTISKFDMIKKGDKVILGVSGGPDSICLLHLMKKVRCELGIDLVVAHLDHMFRGEESLRDFQFVEGLCKKWDIAFYGKKVNVPNYIMKTKLSPEDAARRLRYNFFATLMEEIDADKVATGHNRNDHEETILMNILRGSGLDGLMGIDPVRDSYIRPLIEISREEIEKYLEGEGIPYRTDSTNLTVEYFRNSLRLELIPIIEERYCSHLGSALRRLSEIARQDLDYIKQETSKVFNYVAKIRDGIIYIDIAKFLKLHEAIKHRILRTTVEFLCGDTKDFELKHSKILSRFIGESSAGGRIDLPKGLYGEKEYKYFIVSKKGHREIPEYYYKLDIPGKVFIRETKTTIKASINEYACGSIDRSNPLIAQLDYDKIKSNLIVRNRRPGDRFIPLGSRNFKKIKDFFIDEKIPRFLRNNIPILESNGDIVWVGGMRIDDRFKITTRTKTSLVLNMEQEDPSC